MVFATLSVHAGDGAPKETSDPPTVCVDTTPELTQLGVSDAYAVGNTKVNSGFFVL